MSSRWFTLRDHPILPPLAPYCRVEVKKTGHPTRLEIRSGVPQWLAKESMSVEVRCCACGEPMHPLRNRTKGSGERVEEVRHMYMSVACPHEVSRGCANGKAAREEVLAVGRILINHGAQVK